MAGDSARRRVQEGVAAMAIPSGKTLDPVARYMRLLLAAETRRVSTLVTTSTPPALIAQAAGVDKVCGELAAPILRDDLVIRLKTASIGFRPTKLRDKRWYLEMGGPKTGIYFYLGHQNAPGVRKLVTRPSAFPSFQAYRSFMAKFLTEQELSELRLTRIDLALDYEAPLEQILQGLDVKQKRVRVTYNDHSSIRTGMTIGKGSETIVVYDKARESKLPQPRTRIEIQLKGAKLPARSLDDLAGCLDRPEGRPTYFDNVTLSRVSVSEARDGLTDAQITRLADLRLILKREGLLSAKRTLNTNGNFLRDYAANLQVIPVREQPSMAFHRLISQFLNEPTFAEATQAL